MSSAQLLEVEPVGAYGQDQNCSQYGRERTCFSRQALAISRDTCSPLEYQAGDEPVPGYTLVRRLGGGSMGVVWLARNQQGFELALKVVGLESSGGRKEWRGLAIVRQRRIHHGNLLRLYDYWLKDREGNMVTDVYQSLAGSSLSSHGSLRRASAASTARANLGSTLGRRTLGGPEADEAAVTGSQPPDAQAAQLLLAMDLGDGTLDDVREKHQAASGGVPIDELLCYMRQAASGLDHLHAAGIVHRDVKPHNIMLVGNVATIADYGLAIASDIDVKATSNAFSAAYASPEAVGWRDGLPALTGKADQYSLAITYYELRTGRLPFFHETLSSIYTAKETGKYDLSPIENKAVRAVLRRALSRSPGDRYASCGELVRELDRAEHGRGATQAALTLAAALIVMLVSALAAYPVARGWLARGAQPRSEQQVVEHGTPLAAEDIPNSDPYSVQLVAAHPRPAANDSSSPRGVARRHDEDDAQVRRESSPFRSQLTIHRFFVSPPLPADNVTNGQRLPASREPTADELVNLAEVQLTPDDADDLLALLEISTERATAAIQHLAAARKERGDDAYLQGLEAVALAITAVRSGSAADWVRIEKLAHESLAGWSTSFRPERSSRRGAVEYVRALATAKMQNAPLEKRLTALQTLGGLLSRYFAPQQRATDRDVEIYGLIVLPALSIPLDGPMSDNVVRQILVPFRTAADRLLARNPEGLLIRPSQQRQ